MRIVATETLKRFAAVHPQFLVSIETWIFAVSRSQWDTPNDIKRDFATASILRSSRVVFNVQGNSLRIVTAILFKAKAVLIKFIGTHAEYDRIDANTVEQKKWRASNGD
jgi:mRNA interferase HigB